MTKKQNSLGLAGVSKKNNRFRAAIRHKGKWINLGMFDTAEEAHKEYVNAKEGFKVSSDIVSAVEVKQTMSKKQEAKEYPNLLKRDFSTDKINQKWVTDITYIYTLSDGWCYLSSILDLHSRKIIAWRLSR